MQRPSPCNMNKAGDKRLRWIIVSSLIVTLAGLAVMGRMWLGRRRSSYVTSGNRQVPTTCVGRSALAGPRG